MWLPRGAKVLGDRPGADATLWQVLESQHNRRSKAKQRLVCVRAYALATVTVGVVVAWASLSSAGAMKASPSTAGAAGAAAAGMSP